MHNLHIWLPGYLKHQWASKGQPRPTKVWLTVADHYEPYWGKADHNKALARVQQWRGMWPQVAMRHTDSAGKPPRYTFFYAEEDYHPKMADWLSEMVQLGIADVEIHLHHDGEGEQEFVSRMQRFMTTLHNRHGLLRESGGKLTFGFIHGNWALANSRPDGRRCGLNHELLLLKGLGCYADFTLPAAPHAAQTAMVNTIYWAKNVPDQPKSHNRGTPVVPGSACLADLLIVPGPLGMNFRGSHRVAPRIETGELAFHDPPVKGRAHSWLKLAPRIGNHIFLKLFTHGAQDLNAQLLLGSGLDDCFDDVRSECAQSGYELYFASAWEMRQAIDAVRRGADPIGVAQGTAVEGEVPHDY
jgi:hypothetical protein